MCSAQCHSSILQLPQLKEALGGHYLGEHLGESWFPLSLFFPSLTRWCLLSLVFQ